MVLVTTLSTKFNKAIATFLLRNGLTARFILGWGVIRDNPILDSFLLLPFAQKLISIEVQDDVTTLLSKKKEIPTLFDQWVDRIWDRFIEPIHPYKKDAKGEQLSNEEVNINNTSLQVNRINNNPRLKILESYLRPALVPTNEWIDITRWQFNNRFLKWVRGEYLIAKYGLDVKEALRSHPSLRIAHLQQKRQERRLNDSIFGSIFFGSDTSDMIAQQNKDNRLFLPSSQLVIKAFAMENWNQTKVPLAEYQTMEKIIKRLGGTVEKIVGANILISNVADDTDISSLSLEEILEVAGCHVAYCGAFNALCEDGDIYEYWTKDYISKLASYLLDRCEEFDYGDTVILHVGAGDGSLTFYLNECMKLEKKKRMVVLGGGGKKNRTRQQKRKLPFQNKNTKKEVVLPKFVAVDDRILKIKTQVDVERLNVVESMEKYGPLGSELQGQKQQQLIVICNWMPMGKDWTQNIRDGGANEYILIGESDDGNCGHNWFTWGNISFLDQKYTKEVEGVKVQPPYVVDGYKRIDMEELSKVQVSRFDSSVSSASKTVCFRKI